MSEKKAVEILLQSVRLPVTGAPSGLKTTHLVTTDLIWPRVGIAQKEASQTIQLQNRVCDVSNANWGKRIFFRETVEGHFAIRVAVTEVLDDEKLEQFLRSIIGSAFSLGADTVQPLVPFAGALAAAPLDYLGKEIAKYPGAETIAEGMAEVDTADFPASGEQLLTVQLAAAKSIFSFSARKAGNKKRGLLKKLLLKKGDLDGELTLAIRMS